MITDIKPNTTIHYLVLPKVHIESVDSLTADNLVLCMYTSFLPPPSFKITVKKMITVCETLLQQAAPEAPKRIGFHKPPFISIKHLHLHGMVIPPSRSTFPCLSSFFCVLLLILSLILLIYIILGTPIHTKMEEVLFFSYVWKFMVPPR